MKARIPLSAALAKWVVESLDELSEPEIEVLWDRK